MTLAAGDVLLVGLPENLPLARAGDRVAVEIEGLGRLENPLVAELPRRATHEARARCLRGVIHAATEDAGGVRLGSGECIAASEVVWLPRLSLRRYSPSGSTTLITPRNWHSNHSRNRSFSSRVRAPWPGIVHAPVARKLPSCTTNASWRW